MGWLHTAIVSILAVIVMAFAIQNLQSTTVSLFNLQMSAPLAVVIIIVYLLGMLTGGSAMSLLRWSFSDPEKKR
jgi:putative membrane protein